MKKLTTALFLAAVLAAPVHADDRAVNAVYERMSRGMASLDPAIIEQVYAADAAYLPRQTDATLDKGGALIAEKTGMFLKQVSANKGAVSMAFRIVERKSFGDVVVDQGYFRTSITPRAGAKQQDHYGKFTTVVAKQKNGTWAIVADGDSESTAARFNEAVGAPNAKFDS